MKPTRRAYEIVDFINLKMPLTYRLVKEFSLAPRDASYILGLAGTMFGPGGLGRDAYARSVQRELNLAEMRAAVEHMERTRTP